MIFIEINFEDINKYSFTIIDIRDNLTYQTKHLNGSINIPFTELLINYQKYLNKTNIYLLICEYGLKSKKTAEILNKQGYKVYSLKKGIKNIKS